jgi:hypothetical protein
MNVTFICVDCSQYWADWAGFNLGSDNQDCLPRALLALDWASSEEVAFKSEADQKDLLVKGLNGALNPEYHSMPDLSQRSLTGKQGSLCGLAALYSSLADTLLTKAQLRAYDKESMRKFIQKIITDYPWPFDADQQEQHRSEGKMNQLADAHILHLLYIGKILMYFFLLLFHTSIPFSILWNTPLFVQSAGRRKNCQRENPSYPEEEKRHFLDPKRKETKEGT